MGVVAPTINSSAGQGSDRHVRAYLSENGSLEEKRSAEWAKSRKGSDRKSDRTRQKNNRGDVEKWDQTDIPEIPDRGETSGKNPASLRGFCQEEIDSVNAVSAHGSNLAAS